MTEHNYHKFIAGLFLFALSVLAGCILYDQTQGTKYRDEIDALNKAITFVHDHKEEERGLMMAANQAELKAKLVVYKIEIDDLRNQVNRLQKQLAGEKIP